MSFGFGNNWFGGGYQERLPNTADLVFLAHDAAGTLVDTKGKLVIFVDLSGNSNHLPVMGFSANWSGAEYLSAAHITGSETVIEKIDTETSVISFAAGRINFTAGTCSYLKLSNGDELIIESLPDSLQKFVWDIANGKTYTISPSPAVPFFTVETVGSLLYRGYAKDSLDGVERVVNGNFDSTSDWTSQLGAVLTAENNELTVVSTGVNSLAKQTISGVATTDTVEINCRLISKQTNANIRFGGESFSLSVGANTFTSTSRAHSILELLPAAGTTAVFAEVSIEKKVSGLVPASKQNLSVSAIGQPITHTVGDWFTLPAKIYPSDTQSFRDLADIAGVLTTLYPGDIPTGLFPQEWSDMIVGGNLNNCLMLSTSKNILVGWDSPLSGPPLVSAIRYLGVTGGQLLFQDGGGVLFQDSAELIL